VVAVLNAIVSVIEEHFKGGAVMDVAAWMEFETARSRGRGQIPAGNRTPA